MGDVGDYWREAREFKRDRRAHWHECPDCAVRFGTGTKAAPGCKCRNCDWIAPGQRGEDVQAARKDEARRDEITAEAEKRRLSVIAKRTCSRCGKRLGSPHAKAMHERDKHGVGALAKASVS